MIREIRSRDNALYKYVQTLQKPAVSRREKVLLAEGFRLAEEALNAGLDVLHVLLTASAQTDSNWYRIAPWWEMLQEKADCLLLDETLFRSLSATKQPQGFALVCRSPMVEQPAIPPEPDGLYMLLEAVQDPGNVGTIIRSADAFGFSGVLLVGGCAWPYYDKTLRASMGSAFHLPIYMFDSIGAAYDWLRQAQVRILAATPDGHALDLTDGMVQDDSIHWTRPLAVLVGNEGAVLSQQAIALSDHTLRIPMPGDAESLNVAAAASILAFEMMRRSKPARG